MKTPKICSMPECSDFPVNGNDWCSFHIKEAQEEFANNKPHAPLEIQVGDWVIVKNGRVGANYIFKVNSICYDYFAKDFQVSGNSYGPRLMSEVARCNEFGYAVESGKIGGNSVKVRG